MKVLKLAALLVTVTAFSQVAVAREVVPVVDYIDVPITTSSGKRLTAEQVQEAIAAAARFNRWEVTRAAGGDMLTASLHFKGKHAAAVSIPYSADKFSIKYLNSVNLKYRLSEAAPGGSTDLTRLNAPNQGLAAGTPLIHPAYNKWVESLLQGIQFELKKQ